MPTKSLVNIGCTADVVTRRIALTAEDVDKSLTNALHAELQSICRATEKCQEIVLPAVK